MVKTGNKNNKGRTTQSERAGLIFPVGRIGRLIRQNKWSTRVSASAPIYLASVMEYLCAELLEISGLVCKEYQKRRITPRHIEFAVRNDDDFSKLFQNKTFNEGGVTPINAINAINR